MDNHVFAAKPPNKRPRAPFIAATVVIALFFVAAFVFALRPAYNIGGADSQTVLGAPPQPPAGFLCTKSDKGDFTVYTKQTIIPRASVKEILEQCEQTAVLCRFLFPKSSNEPIKIIIYPSRGEFDEAIREQLPKLYQDFCSGAAGAAFCPERIIVIHSALIGSEPVVTAAHELVHIYTPIDWPSWAKEGIARFIGNPDTSFLYGANKFFKKNDRKTTFEALLFGDWDYKIPKFHDISYSLTAFLMQKILKTEFPEDELDENKLIAARKFVDFMDELQKVTGEYKGYNRSDIKREINQLLLDMFDIDIGVFISQWERWEKENLGKI